MVKTQKKRKQAQRKRLLFSVLVIFIGLIALVALSLGIRQWSNLSHVSEREDRIVAVYKSFDLDDSYQMESYNVFGDKRPYDWDKSRSYSSAIEYVHPATVQETVTELDAKIKAAGFTFIDEPYPGSTSTQYHYKSEAGVFVRLTVSSKPYDDAVQSALLVDKDADLSSFDSLDQNAAPANVIIKVNLDDNNE